MTEAHVTERLLTFVNEELLSGDERVVGPDDELVLDGTLDSLAVARLVAFVEADMRIRVPPTDVTIDHFRTMGSLGAYLVARGDLS